MLKLVLPSPVRWVLRLGLTYGQRVLRWPIILWQVRGVTRADWMVLVRSAILAPVYSARDLQAWQDPILLGDAMVDVPGIGRFSVRARTDDLWHVVPWREQSIANAMREVLKPGDTFIDAGANIGIYTVLASRLVGSSGKVIAVEMMPDTADRLDLHARINEAGNVTLIRNAISDAPGQLVRATVQDGKHGQATIAADSARYGVGRAVQVETVTLDALTASLDRVRLMKIDVEGAELQALRGAGQLLRKLEMIVYESLGCMRDGSDPVDELLETAGFSVRQLDGNNWLASRQGM